MKIKATLLALLLLLTALTAQAGAPRFADFTLAEISNQPLADGLVLWTYALRAGEGEDMVAQRLHVLEIAPGTSLHLVSVSRDMQVKTLQTVPEAMALAAQLWPWWTPVAAINGDFFDTAAGGALGLTIREGRLIQTGEFPQGWSLGFTAQGQARLGQPQVQLYLSAQRDGQPLMTDLPIDALNALRADVIPSRSAPRNAYQARQDNRLVLYTADWYRATMAADGGWETALAVEGALTPGGTLHGTVRGYHDTARVTVAGDAQVPQGTALKAGTAVLSATGDAIQVLRRLNVGDRVSIRAQISQDWTDIVSCLGGGRPDGGPLLVQDGIIQPEHPEVDDYGYFYPSRHPRTAAGIRADGRLFLLMARGYRPGEADGLSVAELAQVMLDLGAHTALNLDGGPSSSLAVRTPDGFLPLNGRTRQTPVGNALVICAPR
ncbi:MAG: phosphodiester glycosidase family protein [Clostridiales bacterium]|nr:phosphodiester glycosidase family protein [Clostridiales bacterium]